MFKLYFFALSDVGSGTDVTSDIGVLVTTANNATVTNTSTTITNATTNPTVVTTDQTVRGV